MEIKKAEFFKSAVKPEQYPADHLPQIVFVGKSNVGKSSFINCLCNNFKLAKTSGQPGKTRSINFYRINDSFYFVDLPGYGFARVPKEEKEKWGQMMETYFSRSKNLVLIIQLIDSRHNPTAEDKQMMDWIRYYGFPVVVAATKIDKLGKSKWKKQLDELRKALALEPEISIVPVSAQTRVGRNEMLRLLDAFLSKKED